MKDYSNDLTQLFPDFDGEDGECGPTMLPTESIEEKEDAKPIRGGDLFKLIEGQGYKCAYSGRDLAPETASLDHMVPVSRGGSHDLSNIRIVHREVNVAKGTMRLEDFVAMCRDVASYFSESMQTHST